MKLSTPAGMSRRHFLSHVAAGSAAAVGAMEFLAHLEAHAAEVQKNRKACILVWLGGGAPTIDMWDLKPGSRNGGEFQPISKKGDLQISEHLPKIAQMMDSMSVVRSMSTREADHARGTYYMHTAYVPNPTVVHPTFGSVVSYELGRQRTDLEIPAFISIGGGGMSPGFLGMTHAPFVVDARGRIQNAELSGMDQQRLGQRLQVLSTIEDGFIRSNRGDVGQAHRDVYQKAVNLMTSSQLEAFRADRESAEVRAGYGDTPFGNSLIMARRLRISQLPSVQPMRPSSDTPAPVGSQRMPTASRRPSARKACARP